MLRRCGSARQNQRQRLGSSGSGSTSASVFSCHRRFSSQTPGHQQRLRFLSAALLPYPLRHVGFARTRKERTCKLKTFNTCQLSSSVTTSVSPWAENLALWNEPRIALDYSGNYWLVEGQAPATWNPDHYKGRVAKAAFRLLNEIAQQGALVALCCRELGEGYRDTIRVGTVPAGSQIELRDMQHRILKTLKLHDAKDFSRPNTRPRGFTPTAENDLPLAHRAKTYSGTILRLASGEHRSVVDA